MNKDRYYIQEKELQKRRGLCVVELSDLGAHIEEGAIYIWIFPPTYAVRRILQAQGKCSIDITGRRVGLGLDAQNEMQGYRRGEKDDSISAGSSGMLRWRKGVKKYKRGRDEPHREKTWVPYNSRDALGSGFGSLKRVGQREKWVGRQDGIRCVRLHRWKREEGQRDTPLEERRHQRQQGAAYRVGTDEILGTSDAGSCSGRSRAGGVDATREGNCCLPGVRQARLCAAGPRRPVRCRGRRGEQPPAGDGEDGESVRLGHRSTDDRR